MIFENLIYKYIIDPLLFSVRKRIVSAIQPQQTVLDLACGTGALVFQLSGLCREATGIDLEKSVIMLANTEKRRKEIPNIRFFVADATAIPELTDKSFDVVTISMAVHQFDPNLYQPLLNEAKRLGKTVIIADYNVPLPVNLNGVTARFIEFLAGREHFRNFRKFYRKGGLEQILSHHGFHVVSSETFGNGIFKMVTCVLPEN